MGSKERRQRERQDTRTRILDAARDMFATDGIDHVTMRAIAGRIEYTPTAIYHHFKDKHALLRELCARDMRALSQAFQRIGRIEDPVERLRRIGRAYIRFGLENPSHYRFLFMEAPAEMNMDEAPGAAEPEADAFEVLRETVAEAIAAGRFKPEYDDADRVAVMCWGAVHGVVSLTIVFGERWPDWPSAERTGAAAVDAMVDGLLRAAA